jgi:acetyl esterase/lipase
MKFVLSIFLCISIISVSNAQQGYKIWEDIHIPYNRLVTPDLTTFEANSTSNTHVAVIICPGGSYHHLGMKNEGFKVAKWFQSKGITAFVLRYRVGFWGYHHPAMIQDLQRSIQFVKENAHIWGIDTSKVGLIGFSAGGHLVGTAGTLFRENYLTPLGIHTEVSLRPNFVVAVYPVISMQDSLAHKRSRENLFGRNFTKEQMNKMSLENRVNHIDPPMMIVVAKDDPVVNWRNSFYFYKSLQAAGVPSKLLLNENGGHGFGIDPKKGGKAALWNIECIKWLHEIGILSDNITSLI